MNVDVQNLLATIVLVPVIAFALYRRSKKLFGRQPISKNRIILRMLGLGLVGLFILATARTAAGGLLAAGVGGSLGLALGNYGLLHTRFEVTPNGNFYTPNKWIGLSIMALFLGRIAVRFFTVYQAVRHLAPGVPLPADFQRSQLTAGVIFLMVGYYLFHYGGVLYRNRILVASAPIVSEDLA